MAAVAVVVDGGALEKAVVWVEFIFQCVPLDPFVSRRINGFFSLHCKKAKLLEEKVPLLNFPIKVLLISLLFRIVGHQWTSTCRKRVRCEL